MEQELFIYNSLTNKKEKFAPINPGKVGYYVCGPTVYNLVHLGNCRTFISFDLVYRYFLHLGFDVRYVRNITDAGHLENDEDEGEDKIAKKARLERIEPMEVVQRYTLDFHNVMREFNSLPPSIEPTATGHIIEQIQMTEKIMDAGLAYEKNGSVYFDVEKYNQKEQYGELSGRKTEDLMSGTRELDNQSEKKSPLDFALWKKAAPEHIMRWPSPWSEGFPGWHLECSVMSSKYLGDQIDIHGGGMDLKFPHHECEIAQGTAANGKKPVNFWMHGNMLSLNGQKMSKSTGNTLMPHELFTGDNDVLDQAYHPMVVRFFMMQAHYRSTLDFSSEALTAAEKGFTRLMAGVEAIENIEPAKQSSFDVQKLVQQFYEAMNDDFNSPILIAHLFEAVKKIHNCVAGQEEISEDDLNFLKEKINIFVFDILGLNMLNEEKNNDNQALDAAMQLLIDLRAKSRKDKDFDTADKIRDDLADAGIQIKDGKEGSSYEVD